MSGNFNSTHLSTATRRPTQSNWTRWVSMIWVLPALILSGCGASSVDVDQIAKAGKQAVTDAPADNISKTADNEEDAPLETGAVADKDSAQEKGWGHLKGKIQVIGKPPVIPPIVIPAAPANCKRGPVPQNDLIVGKNGELRDVFVMMYLKRGAEKPAVHPSYDKALLESVDLDNKNCVFTPHALFVRMGQKLNVKNSDKVGHNCHGKLFNNEFNVNVPVGDNVEIKMEETEKVPGDVVCDIHKWMDAVMLVREEPYVAITDASGSFEIKNIPEGKWTFQFWHKKAGYMKELEITGRELGRRGETELEIKNGEALDLGTLKIPVEAFDKDKKGKKGK